MAHVLIDYDSRYLQPISLTYRIKDCMWDGQWVQLDETDVIGDFNIDFNEDYFI